MCMVYAMAGMSMHGIEVEQQQLLVGSHLAEYAPKLSKQSAKALACEPGTSTIRHRSRKGILHEQGLPDKQL